MQHLRPTLRWIVYLALCIGLVSCASSDSSGSNPYVPVQIEPYRTRTLPVLPPTVNPNQTPQASRMGDFKMSLLGGEPCALPCWQGITPKETTLEEALERLHQLPFITDIHPYGDSEEIVFSVKVRPQGYGGSLIYEKEPPYTIQDIRLSLPPLKLGEVIVAYGEPSYVLVSTKTAPPMHGETTDGPRLFWIGVVYPELGFVAGGRGGFIADAQELERVTLFGTPFELPLDERMRSIFGNMTTSYELIPWQGYQSFAFYCGQVPKSDDRFNSNDCPDYVLTLTPQPKNP